MVKLRKNELVRNGFDYRALEVPAAEKVRSAADRIRLKVKKTVEDLIEIGKELLTIKESLPHGVFGRWLKAEFGWRERMARNFMSVAEQFGAKAAIIADLAIQPTAAYLLAAPSVPEEARQQALQRAEAGEPITAKVAKEIVTKARKRQWRKLKAVPTGKLELRLTSVLRQYKERWKVEEQLSLVRLLREFADDMEKPLKGSQKKAH
jgi:hypothetical protein